MSKYVLRVAGQTYEAEVKELTPERATVVVDDTEYAVDLVEIGRRDEALAAPAVVRRPSSPSRGAAPAPASPPPAPAGGAGVVVAPLPGAVFQLKVREGETVQAGQTVLVMEAMKMENPVPAPYNGTVKKVFVAEGDNVGEGDALVEISRPEMTTL